MSRGKRLYRDDLLQMDGKKVLVWDEDFYNKDVAHTIDLNHEFEGEKIERLVDEDDCYYEINNCRDNIETYELIEEGTSDINCTIENEEIVLPKYESVCASGMDLRAYKFALPSNLKETLEFPYTLKPLERILVKTGLHIELPENIEAQIRPRSGLALKNGISIVNSPGTIDEDYRGDIGVVLVNLSNEDFLINKGDRIAQMVFAKVEKFDLKIVNELSSTIRGTGGFCSTGTK